MGVMEKASACTGCDVRTQAICHVLGGDALARFADSGRRRSVRKGETVMWQGDQDGACATLTRGALKMVVVNEEGDERIVGTVYPADFVGSPFQSASTVQVTALTDSELCIFSRAAFAEALQQNRPLERELLRRTMADLERTRLDDSRMASLGARARVAALLADLAGRARPGCAIDPDGWLNLPLTRGEMAAMLDLRIETVSREITALESDGIIQRRGRSGLNVIDTRRLQEAAS